MVRATKTRNLLRLGAIAIAVSAATSSPTINAPPSNGPRDLQGVWNFSSDVPLERPSGFANKKFFTPQELEQQKARQIRTLEIIKRFAPIEAVGVPWLDYAGKITNLRTSLITYPEDGRLPKLVDGVRRVHIFTDLVAALNDGTGAPSPAALSSLNSVNRDRIDDFTPGERCLSDSTIGPPLVPAFESNYVQIIQSTDALVLFAEPLHVARIVPLNGQPRSGDRLRSWFGESRGHWEGDALIVETRNFNDRTPSFAGAGRSYDKTVVERFTRTSARALQYEATIIDPATFQDKIVLSYPWAMVDTRIYESACHEGNYSMANALAGARKQDSIDSR